jgi:hypothetical protein
MSLNLVKRDNIEYKAKTKMAMVVDEFFLFARQNPWQNVKKYCESKNLNITYRIYFSKMRKFAFEYSLIDDNNTFIPTDEDKAEFALKFKELS